MLTTETKLEYVVATNNIDPNSDYWHERRRVARAELAEILGSKEAVYAWDSQQRNYQTVAFYAAITEAYVRELKGKRILTVEKVGPAFAS